MHGMMSRREMETMMGRPVHHSRASMGSRKVEKVMHEYKEGMLHSGSKSGPRVTSREQAVAIAMSEAGMARKKKKTKGY